MLFIDIETLPPLGWDDAKIDAYVRERVPGTFKKPESIAQWCEENRTEVFARAALDWRVSRIACIGVIYDDGETVMEDCFMGGTTDAHEAQALRNLDDFLSAAAAHDGAVCGHNVLSFDLPRLHITAARVGSSLTSWLAQLSRHSRSRVVDTMHLAFPTRERVGLADLGEALGVGGKSGHGSEVLAMYTEGRHGELMRYCLDDVRLTREVYRRLSGEMPAYAPVPHPMNMDRSQVAALIDNAMRRDA